MLTRGNGAFPPCRSISRMRFGQQVVTFAMIDKVHGRVKDTAKRTFNENRGRFDEGIDFVKVRADEIRTRKIVDISPKARGDIYFITRRGYLKIVKSLNGDRAWAARGHRAVRCSP